MNSKPRYAIYFAPKEGSPLENFGKKWLNRTAEHLNSTPESTPQGFSYQEHLGLVATPKHYGFHATLKAPFELRDNKSEQELYTAFEEFSATSPAFTLQGLQLRNIGKFIALAPLHQEEKLTSLHSNLVKEFDEFRAHINEFDKNRYAAKYLNADEQKYLDQYGYPYIFDLFQFHLTLTGTLTLDEEDIYLKKLKELTKDICNTPLVIDQISLFYQPSRKDPFICIKSCVLGG